MTGRRSSARIAAQSQNSSSPSQPKSSPVSRKRKNEAAGSSPSAKRGKKEAEPQQKTLEETIQNGEHDQPAPEKQNQEEQKVEEDKHQAKSEESTAQQANGHDVEESGQEAEGQSEKITSDSEKVIGKADEATVIQKQETTAQENAKPKETNGTAVISDGREDDDVPSSILEKGVIYFFFRARVNVDDAQDVKDVARTYIVLHPLPLDAKLGDGPIGDQGNCRLLALPKKVLPRSGRDRFLAFVEKAKTNVDELKKSFLAGSEYATKTQGTSHSPPATPLAEGVYAITSTGRESHLAYIITIPAELGQVQQDLGLQERGSWVLSVKNPAKPQPSNTSLPKAPEYPQHILDEFRGLRWKPLEPKFLDYPDTQVLIIGGHWDTATEQRPKDERENNVPPEDELDRLEGEDEIRVNHLKGDDTVFAELGVASKDFPTVPTTW